MLGRGLKRGSKRRPVQLALRARTWGGAREGAGRKAANGRRNVAHTKRPPHAKSYPVHVTLRARRDLPTLRAQRIFWRLCTKIQQASHSGFRIVALSVQRDHIHFLVEAPDRTRLSRGLQGLAIRLARVVNRLAARRGRVWADRYHAHELRSPREVRNALAYVLMNARKHTAHGSHAPHNSARAGAPSSPLALDPFSSAGWFDGWTPRAGPLIAQLLTYDHAEACPTVAPRTWLAREGWAKRGLLSPEEGPRPTRA